MVIGASWMWGSIGSEAFHHSQITIHYGATRQPIVRSTFAQSAWSPVWMVRT